MECVTACELDLETASLEFHQQMIPSKLLAVIADISKVDITDSFPSAASSHRQLTKTIWLEIAG